ncbi:hypothetical protein C4573_03660 [Candidatus Woesearchaeota archaeon]|nr:MAG: hypothetical protein C4573_03660 [Candidatus Woesearchaeota archaeon]
MGIEFLVMPETVQDTAQQLRHSIVGHPLKKAKQVLDCVMETPSDNGFPHGLHKVGFVWVDWRRGTYTLSIVDFEEKERNVHAYTTCDNKSLSQVLQSEFPRNKKNAILAHSPSLSVVVNTAYYEEDPEQIAHILSLPLASRKVIEFYHTLNTVLRLYPVANEAQVRILLEQNTTEDIAITDQFMSIVDEFNQKFSNEGKGVQIQLKEKDKLGKKDLDDAIVRAYDFVVCIEGVSKNTFCSQAEELDGFKHHYFGLHDHPPSRFTQPKGGFSTLFYDTERLQIKGLGGNAVEIILPERVTQLGMMYAVDPTSRIIELLAHYAIKFENKQSHEAKHAVSAKEQGVPQLEPSRFVNAICAAMGTSYNRHATDYVPKPVYVGVNADGDEISAWFMKRIDRTKRGQSFTQRTIGEIARLRADALRIPQYGQAYYPDKRFDKRARLVYG